jgi:hypothetical protein
MNIDRILRDVDASLTGRDEALRHEILDALREAFARERRRLDPALTVESERERRQHAEELRGALEAIHTSVRPEESLDEVLRQLQRVVEMDFAAVATLDPGAGFRVVAVRGGEPAALVGATLAGPQIEEAREARRPVNVADAEAEKAPLPLEGAPALRSWMVLPLLLEADVIGVLVAGRAALDTFTEDETALTRAVAFWAAAALRRGQLLGRMERYAALLEQVAGVDERVFRGDTPQALLKAVVDGACRVGNYRGGMAVLQTPRGPVVAAVSGEAFAGTEGRVAPPDLATTDTVRLAPDRMLAVAEALGTATLPAEQLYLVPFATDAGHFGCLAVLDPNGESPDDRLLEAFATRAASAWRHAALHHAED